MKKVLASMWKEEDGVLSFEWVLLVTLLTVGIVAGVAGARDAIIDELGDVAQAMLALDQSYSIDFPLGVLVHSDTASSASDSSFVDDRIAGPGYAGHNADRQQGHEQDPFEGEDAVLLLPHPRQNLHSKLLVQERKTRVERPDIGPPPTPLLCLNKRRLSCCALKQRLCRGEIFQRAMATTRLTRYASGT